ncbi:MAG: fibronectin type III domain-containing protein [Candidatus Shapirobacteria bacterium]|jgi:hypothetical protein
MKKKVNVKMIVIFAVMLVVMVFGVVGVGLVRTFMSGASSAVEPKGVIAVSNADGKSATVSWTSDKESISKVEYGTTAASLVLMGTEIEPTVDHRLSLTSLRPGTTYYYRIRIGEEIFDNGGIPYSFKTKDDIEVTPTVTLVPTVTSLPLAETSTGTSSASICDSKIDYNKDGVVNSFDILSCKKSNGTVKGVTTSVCDNPTDLNNDGKVNSLDRAKCLQDKKL